jgi:hypothetical protein
MEYKKVFEIEGFIGTSKKAEMEGDYYERHQVFLGINSLEFILHVVRAGLTHKDSVGKKVKITVEWAEEASWEGYTRYLNDLIVRR